MSQDSAPGSWPRRRGGSRCSSPLASIASAVPVALSRTRGRRTTECRRARQTPIEVSRPQVKLDRTRHALSYEFQVIFTGGTRMPRLCRPQRPRLRPSPRGRRHRHCRSWSLRHRRCLHLRIQNLRRRPSTIDRPRHLSSTMCSLLRRRSSPLTPSRSRPDRRHQKAGPPGHRRHAPPTLNQRHLAASSEQKRVHRGGRAALTCGCRKSDRVPGQRRSPTGRRPPAAAVG
jgi:hypothetical protein